MPDRELFTGLDVYVDALNAINASQGWARRINDDVRKENIHGEFRFPSATSADVALAKRIPIGFRLSPKGGAIIPEAIRTTGSAGTFSRVILRSLLAEIV